MHTANILLRGNIIKREFCGKQSSLKRGAQMGKETMKISPCALGMGFGALWGLYLFILALTTAANINFIWFNVGTFNMIQTVYPWYAVGLIGAFVGLILGVICGYICGFIIAWTYNFMLEKCKCRWCKA